MTEEEFTSRFDDEKKCVEYIRLRIETKGIKCPGCGKKPSSFDRYNRKWKCDRCRKSIPLTIGTVMAYSKFPLKHWMTAIYRMSENETVLAKDLQNELEEHTPNHVRVMMLRIRSAMSQYLVENRIKRRLPAAEMTRMRSDHHGIHEENLNLYRDELVYRKAVADAEDKFNFLLDICLTHTTDVKLKR